jgi:hypothetical protein
MQIVVPLRAARMLGFSEAELGRRPPIKPDDEIAVSSRRPQSRIFFVTRRRHKGSTRGVDAGTRPRFAVAGLGEGRGLIIIDGLSEERLYLPLGPLILTIPDSVSLAPTFGGGPLVFRDFSKLGSGDRKLAR